MTGGFAERPYGHTVTDPDRAMTEHAVVTGYFFVPVDRGRRSAAEAVGTVEAVER